MKTFKEHNERVKKISQQIAQYSSKENKKIRFFHGDSNSTRKNDTKNYYWIDISGLNDILEVNVSENYALVEPNVPMDKLVNATLEFGLIPPVVMEFPGITVGGGINGAALESSSYKFGQFCDICEEYEIILGNGEIITASPKQNSDIFYGISGSYGTFGLLTSIKIKLIPSAPYVHTTFYPIHTTTKALSFLTTQMKNKELDYIEGIIFDSTHSVVITGKLTHDKNLPVKTYSKSLNPWFYETGKKVAKNAQIYEELIPIKEYLFRYNRGAFWMGEYAFSLFHLPRNAFTRFLLNPFMNTRKLHDGLEALNIGQNYFVQDFYVPLDKTEGFLRYTEKELNIFPVWLCPVKPTSTPQKLSPNFIKSDVLIDIGIWGTTDKYSVNPIEINRKFEAYAKRNNSRKMFYAHAYYSEDEFWTIYDKKWYNSMRNKYHANAEFPNIWQKVQVSEKYTMRKWRGILKILGETILGKHINT